MNELERTISDRSFEKLSSPSFRPSRMGRTVRNMGRTVGRGIKSTARSAANTVAHNAEDIAGAASDAGTDGVNRMVQGEIANRGIEAGGDALANFGEVGAIGSAGSMRGANTAIRSGTNNAARATGGAVNTTARSIPRGSSVGVQSRVQAVKNMRNVRRANTVARTARQVARPTRQMMVHEAQRAGMKATTNAMKQLYRSNTGNRLAARAAGKMIGKGMPIIGLGVDMGLDGVGPALKENFRLTAPETNSGLETVARAGGDLLTAASGLVNPLAIPMAVPAAVRTLHRVGRAVVDIPKYYDKGMKMKFNRELAYAKQGKPVRSFWGSKL